MQNSSQQFCVKWNSYSSNLQNVFPRLLTSEHFVDITLACEGQMIKCHKVVLSACSTYFENLLVQNPCQHPIVFMKDMKHWEVQALVDFMYKGEVNVSQDELDSLLVAAEALQIRGLCSSDQSYVGNQQEQSQSDQNRIHTVTLPHDTILSGRESPPQKRRRNMTEDQIMPSLLTDSNRANLVPTSTSSMEVSALPLSTSATSSQVIPSKSEAYGDQLEKKKGIKQEVDFEDCYIEGDGVDGDGPDDDYSIERQGLEDSDSKEDGLSALKMGQPGPSGLTNSGIAATNNKAPTAFSLWPPRVRSYRQYTNDNLWAALMAVKCGGSVYRASKEHGIPRKTLRNWMKRWNIKSQFAAPGRKPVQWQNEQLN